ncbi:GGDEF domain-containing protein [Paenibacillus aceris]|uniref:Diguanylate cyclase (GGDEF)-like protein n=1 Tax=Paenibacillus aceris TaxID=869555 RepID=A0ABS4I2R1_9BACL|nr:GGDEF domain-containing protein [Paenibacillus aceris]MBP1965194.1 diguanylate cyclase (GGDEF)-like protein [Paenibacillus aceris]NHW33171.1 GGDEF domain-containing protein [Paenibacillus aceris]
MHFSHKLWHYFHYKQIESRLTAWTEAAKGDFFRQPTGWNLVEGNLIVQLPSLPEGFIPLSQLDHKQLSDEAKGKLLISICEALTFLHDKQFFMGFLLPDMLFFHPKTKAILLDVQPFPSAIEFINHLLTDYPYRLFPRYARRFLLSRIADFESIHLLLDFMYDVVPAALQPLSERLRTKPETFLFADEIAASLRASLHLPVKSQPNTAIQIRSNLLHPSASPLSHEQQELFRVFLKSNEDRLLGLICEDEAIRFDLYAQYINEVIEKGYYFKIISQELPYSTLREVVSRTLHRAYDILPESVTMLRNLARKFDQLLKKHYEGDDILYLLTEWLHQFFSSVIPLFPIQNFVFTFENCEHFDEDSQLILLNFWREHGHEMKCLHFIFSGSCVPTQFKAVTFQTLEILHSDPAIYERLLASQFGRADKALVSELKIWLYENEVNTSHLRIILEELIESHSIGLTRNGWQKTAGFHLDHQKLNPLHLFAKRIALLDKKEEELLRLLCCLPMPINLVSLFTANRLDSGNILLSVAKLAEIGLIHISRNDSLFISSDIANLALGRLSESELATYYQTALKYLYRFRPFALPQLISLSCQAGEYKVEYYLLLKYYRQIRSLLSYSQKAELLERIKYLYEKLERPYLVFLDRLLSRMHHLLNQFALSEKLALTVYERTGRISDRFGWLYIRMIQNDLDVYQLREELFPFILDESQQLADRVRAAFLLNTSNLCFPLQDEEMHRLHVFYTEVVYPKRHLLTLRHFAEITNYYTINMLIHFPETEEWALSITAKLEPLLDSSPHTDLMLRLYDIYSYQSNNKIINTYVYRGIEGAKRSGYTIKEQVGHLNAMELSLNQGDIASYLYHKERVLQVDLLRRKDLAENYLTNQLLFALEWEEWTLFQQLESSLIEQQITDWSLSLLSVFRGYAAFRRHQPVHLPDSLENENHAIFLEALRQTSLGDAEQACKLFEQFISRNNSGLYAGWAYREMLPLLLELRSEKLEAWFDHFEAYLKRYAYDVFWPDYYRLSAEKSMSEGDIQHAMLYLRRALNGYQMIQKETWRPFLTACMERVIAPAYVPASPTILHDEYVQQMTADREQWLLLSLDLQIIIELSEQVTETLDLSTTMQRLTKALFDYFPVIQLSITYKLLHYKQKVFVTASGLRDHDELIAYQARSEYSCALSFTLFQRGDQAITLQVHVDGMTKTKQQHMEHFLSFIKPHIINVLLHREMVIDNLTGFYLRGYFMEKLREEFELASRYQLDLSVIMIDVDNFRRVNEFGHPEGDRVLREIADIFRFNLRKSDIAGRYGGEELILILPKTDGKEALKIAHQLRGEIEKEFAYGRPYNITVSVGVSSLELCKPSSIEQLIEQADTAEITAKRTGKNKVIAAWEMW